MSYSSKKSIVCPIPSRDLPGPSRDFPGGNSPAGKPSPYYVKLLKTFLRERRKTEKYFEGMRKKIPE